MDGLQQVWGHALLGEDLVGVALVDEMQAQRQLLVRRDLGCIDGQKVARPDGGLEQIPFERSVGHRHRRLPMGWRRRNRENEDDGGDGQGQELGRVG